MNLAHLWKRSNPQLERQSFSLNELDLKLEPYLKGRAGFFIEAGANDGIAQSNTLFFERYYGWKGILIEPIPDLAARCRVNRPACVVENCALVPFDFHEEQVSMQYCDLMSIVKGAMKSDDADLEHIKVGCNVQQIETYELKVPARTLSAILNENSVAKVDLLSLDVEGFELNVLKGLDFDRHRPELMLIEARFRNEIDSFLQPLYEPIASLSEHDVLYRIRRS